MSDQRQDRAIRNYFRQGMVLDMDAVNASDKEQDELLTLAREITRKFTQGIYAAIEREAAEREADA